MEKEFEVVARYLIAGERPYAVWRHHWLWWLRRVMISAVLFLVFLGIAQVSGENSMYIVALTPVIMAILKTIHWRRRVVFLTNQRVGEVGGIIPSIQERDVVSLLNVQDIDVERKGWRALLGWNNYNVQTGQGNLPLVGYPAELDTAIWAAKSGNFPSTPTQQPPSGQPTSQGGGTIIVH